jgi:hypothetical protein
MSFLSCRYDGRPSTYILTATCAGVPGDAILRGIGCAGIGAVTSWPSQDLLTPGDPDNSYLVQKLEGTAAVGGRMPQGGPFLDQATIDLVRQWISDGAMNN